MTPGRSAAGRVAAAIPAVLATAGILASCDTQSPGASLVESGRRIYHDGLLPDGSPLVATRPEGLLLEGRFASCATCHRKSGMGTIEGLIDSAILVPPLVGPVLFQPAPFHGAQLDDTHHYVPHESWRRAMTRPAYDRDSLVSALRTGLNSAGDPLGAPMPLYELGANEIDALVAYLEILGAQADPGIDDSVMHVATVVTPDVSAGDADGVLEVLRVWAASARAGGFPLRLHEWLLAGPDSTWQLQLEAHYDAQPVFAVLSGAGAGDWQPVHDFCEAREVACVLPSLDAGPKGDEGHFAIYWTLGVDLEARILAKYLGDKPSDKIVQVFGDEAGQVGADAFAARLAAADVDSRLLDSVAPGWLADANLIVLWLRPAGVMQLVESLPGGPGVDVVISSQLTTPEDISLPPAWRERAAFVSLFDDLGLQGEIARLRLERWLERNRIDAPAKRRMQADAYAAAHLFTAALAAMRREELRRPRVPPTREHLLETLEDIVAKYSDGTQLVDEDSHVAYYGRMSLGPGQRVAVRGGSILRYASPDSPRLVAESEHIVP